MIHSSLFIFQIFIVLSCEQLAICSSDSLIILRIDSECPKSVMIHLPESICHTLISLIDPLIIFSSENTKTDVILQEWPLQVFKQSTEFKSHILNFLSKEPDTIFSFDILSILHTSFV